MKWHELRKLAGASSLSDFSNVVYSTQDPLTQGLPEVHHRDGAGGAAAGQGPAVAADQGEHPGGPGHHQQH